MKYIPKGELRWSPRYKHEIPLQAFGVQELILRLSLIVLKSYSYSIEYDNTIYRIQSRSFEESVKDIISNGINIIYENWKDVNGHQPKIFSLEEISKNEILNEVNKIYEPWRNDI